MTSDLSPLALTGARAFAMLQRVLNSEQVEPARLPEPAFNRLFSTLTDKQTLHSSLDLAILVRHALRYHSLQQGQGESVRMKMRRGEGWPTADQWNSVGVSAEPTDSGFWVSAQPWRPSWLSDVGEDGVDAAPAQAPERRILQATPGDPFLTTLGHEQYHSPGQRAAMRAALTTPPGATLLVCLPTGEGKSLIFQGIAKYGFGDGESSAVTLVVTPTVALALDHDRAARELWPSDEPRAYIGGPDHALANQSIIEHIIDGTQDLCFASPEAVCGSLRPALMNAARAGRLRALVVDEAHLVDTWGGNFRSEFQVLSGVRHDLLGESGGVSPFRTILLSATITPQAESTLRTLFGTETDGSPGQYAVSAAVRLRPEIQYWVALPCREDERRERVLEAVCHLPRPAILYTTLVEDADRWYATLRQMEFRRIACVTGKTDNARREEVIEGWRNDTIDLVVATSAFGLGIDNPHLRTVIHACIPESLDRFYQEVGRGGRDGRASISLLIPAELDRKDADNLSKQRTITVERGFQRWQAMFRHRDAKRVSDYEFLLPLDVPPGFDEQDIDMVSGRNTDWNTRTLTLMATSGLITLLGTGKVPTPNRGDGGVPELAEHLAHSSINESNDGAPSSRATDKYQTVRIHDPRHLDRDTWAEVVEPQRELLDQASKQSFQRMRDFLKQQHCAADILAPQYELRLVQVVHENTGPGPKQVSDVNVARACGGCGHCRAAGQKPYSEPETTAKYPWPSLSSSSSLTDETNRLVIYYEREKHFTRHEPGQQRRDQRKLADLLRNYRIRIVIPLSGFELNLKEVQKQLPHWPFFCEEHIVTPHQLPGTSLLMVPPGIRLTELQLAPQASNNARIYLLPDGFEDPVRPGIPLRETYNGREVEWKDLL